MSRESNVEVRQRCGATFSREKEANRQAIYASSGESRVETVPQLGVVHGHPFEVFGHGDQEFAESQVVAVCVPEDHLSRSGVINGGN